MSRRNKTTTPSVPRQATTDSENSRMCTGILTTLPNSSDLKIESFSMSLYGKELVKNTTLSLNNGRRYGLIGANGCGKSTLLKAMAARELPIPKHMDVYRLDGEVEPSDETALQVVYELGKVEQERLEKQAEELEDEAGDGASELLESIYNRLDELDPSSFESKAGELLHGLGFSQVMMNKKNPGS
jgi:ATP-binding cassette subfamily F protein 2